MVNEKILWHLHMYLLRAVSRDMCADLFSSAEEVIYQKEY